MTNNYICPDKPHLPWECYNCYIKEGRGRRSISSCVVTVTMAESRPGCPTGLTVEVNSFMTSLRRHSWGIRLTNITSPGTRYNFNFNLMVLLTSSSHIVISEIEIDCSDQRSEVRDLRFQKLSIIPIMIMTSQPHMLRSNHRVKHWVVVVVGRMQSNINTL